MQNHRRYLIFLFATLIALACGTGVHSVGQVMNAENTAFAPVLILDAGHGGFDGGATGADGTIEKDINLSITRKLCDLARLGGFEVIMVRETDCAVCDEGLSGLRKKKTSDIHNRLALAQKNPAAIFISIHQNHFQQRKSWGTQVFYGQKNPQSKALAQRLQENIRQTLQPENRREIKPAEKNLYILHHAENTAVLVECGFISNDDECRRLNQEDYQQQLAFEILRSTIEHQISLDS